MTRRVVIKTFKCQHNCFVAEDDQGEIPLKKCPGSAIHGCER